MQPRTIYWTAATDDDDGLCLSQTPGAAGALTFTGALVSGGVGNLVNGDTTAYAGGCSQRRVRITCAGDETGKTILITGTRAIDGLTGPNAHTLHRPISELVTLGAPGTFDTQQDFATVTTPPVISAAAAGAIKIGSSPVASTPWNANDDIVGSPETVGLFIIKESGTVNFTIEHTLERLARSNPLAGEIPRVLPHSVIAAKTASIDGNYGFPITAQRLTMNSGTGLVRYSWRQSGVRGN